MSELDENAPAEKPEGDALAVCPVCGAALVHEKCKVVCRSPACIYRIIYSCAEF